MTIAEAGERTSGAAPHLRILDSRRSGAWRVLHLLR
jgi:hypothetical protein